MNNMSGPSTPSQKTRLSSPGCRTIAAPPTTTRQSFGRHIELSISAAAVGVIDLTLEDSDSDSDSRTDELIGRVFASGRFMCPHRQCVRKSFARLAELKRHYEGAHAPRKHTFWCHVPSCKRSRGVGQRSFPRKDKLKDHVRMAHGGNPELS